MTLTALFLVWLQMSAQPVTRVTMYESMCRRPMVEYGGRYQVIAGAGECFIFERNIGEVYWSGPHGQAILFPIGSPLDDITRAEFAEAAQRAADETDGKPAQYQKPVDLYPVMCADSNTAPHPCENPESSYNGDIVSDNTHLVQIPAPERVDVPAVQVKTSAKLTLAYAGNCVHGYGFEGEKWQCTGKMVWSCAEKSRILEHDENSPPKYWCRKVQP